MKKIMLLVFIFCTVLTGVRGQMITNDPIHTVITTVIKFFQEPSFVQLVGNVKKLAQISQFIRQVNRGVQLADEAQTTIKLINNFGAAMARDKHILPNEYATISKDFNSFSKEVANITKELSEVVKQKKSTMDDGSRLQFVNIAADKLQALNTEIRGYTSKINYISQRRAFGADDKIATARLYKIANEASNAGGGVIGEVDIEDKYPYDLGYNNKGVDFDVEAKMAQEAAMIQQKLYEEYMKKVQIAELEAKSLANLQVPKTTENGFYSIKMKEGACPIPPTPSGSGRTFFGTTMHYDSTSGMTMSVQYEDKGKDEFEAAGRKWEYEMEEICGPLWEAYEAKIELERSRIVSTLVADKKTQYNLEMQDALNKANAAIREKYLGQSSTDIENDSDGN